MEPVKIEELVEEKRISMVRKDTCSLLKLTETMKSLVDEVERLKEEYKIRKREYQSQ